MKSLLNTIKFIIPLLTVSLITAFTFQNDQKAYDIMKKAENQLKGYGKYSVYMEMKLIKENGKSFTREIKSYVIEEENDGEKTLNLFNSPADVKGTKLLSYAHYSETDDQWIFLPALGRTKRIANENKSGAFLGSELAFEDLGNARLDKFTYEYLGEKVIDGKECYHIKSYPKSKYSGYSYIEEFIDKEKFLSVKSNYYDRKKELLKVVKQEFSKISGKTCWFPVKLTVKNVQTGKSTVMTWNEYDFNPGVDKSFFILGNLERAE